MLNSEKFIFSRLLDFIQELSKNTNFNLLKGPSQDTRLGAASFCVSNILFAYSCHRSRPRTDRAEGPSQGAEGSQNLCKSDRNMYFWNKEVLRKKNQKRNKKIFNTANILIFPNKTKTILIKCKHKIMDPTGLLIENLFLLTFCSWQMPRSPS